MDSNVKLGLKALGAFIIAGSAVVAANAVYTNKQVGIDYQTLAIAAAIGVIGAVVLAHQMK
jgi:hypothetical protein